MAVTLREGIPQGTLDMLILCTVARGDQMHGFQIADAIEQSSENVFRVEEGSLYPALQRLLIKGWLVGEWGKTPENRRARYYRITAAGDTQLEKQLAQYQRISAAIWRILAPV